MSPNLPHHSLSSDCTTVRESFSGYLDGTITGREMHSVSNHLEGCSSCASEFAQWRGLQQVLATVGTVKAPSDLGLKLRLAISHESARRQGHWWDAISMRWENLFRPALLQVSAGLLGTLLLVGGTGSIGLMIGAVAAPVSVMANDEPLGAPTSPHFLYSAAQLQPVVNTATDTTIVVQAEINSNGRVYDYQIISGPSDPETTAQIRDHLMVQVYEPARIFGDPVRGRVLLTFAGVSVHG